MSRAFTLIIYAIIATLVLVGLIVLGAGNFEALVWLLSPIPVLAVFLLAARSGYGVRRRRVAVVLTYLEQAVRLNLPLPAFLAAAAASEPLSTARRLKQLRIRLESGEPIGVALDYALPDAPARTVALIHAAERVGRLGPTLDRLVREARRPRTADPSEEAFYRVYPVMMCIALVFIVSTIMIFVIPKYEQIFKDFHTDLPGLTIGFIQISRFVADDYGWIIPVALIGLFVGWSFIWPRGLSWTPAFLRRDRDLADICRVIADALEAGLSFDASVRYAGELRVGSALRRKLYRWAGAMEQGMSISDAARSAQMPGMIVGLTAGQAGLLEAFGFLARYYRSKFSRLVILARGAFVPATVLFFGIIVAMVELGLFLPLLRLMGSSHPPEGIF